MKTLPTPYRVHDLDRSLEFYWKVGFGEVGRVRPADGTTLVMFNLPSDGDALTLELVHNPAVASLEIGNAFSHIAVHVDDLAATLADLAAKGISFKGQERPPADAGTECCSARIFHDAVERDELGNDKRISFETSRVQVRRDIDRVDAKSTCAGPKFLWRPEGDQR